MKKSTIVSTLIVGLAAIIVIAAGGSYLVGMAVDATYSRDWYSASTENAQYRHVFVKSPTVQPSTLVLNDSVAWTVTDAWVEHPTKVVHPWLVMRREVHDSGYRLVINLAQVARDPAVWTHGKDRSFGGAGLEVNGSADVAQSGNAYIQTVYVESDKPFPDTIKLSLQGKGAGAPRPVRKPR